MRVKGLVPVQEGYRTRAAQETEAQEITGITITEHLKVQISLWVLVGGQGVVGDHIGASMDIFLYQAVQVEMVAERSFWKDSSFT